MPRKPHDTTAYEPMQASPAPADEWAREVVSRLPEHTQQQARVLKAFERSRQIRSATDLLRGLLASVYTVHSFQHLSIWSVLVGVADVSATDWRKRLQRASAWLTWLLQEVLATSTAVSPWLLRAGWRRILLIDGTHFTCPGPLGMVWRVHTAFDLVAGRLTQLKVTDRQEGEHLEVFDLQAGDLVITDRANGLRQRIVFVLEQAADLVVRFTPHNLPLEDEQGKAIAVVKWLKGRHAPAGRVLSRRVWISYQGSRIGLRWVALRLSQQQREAAQRRKKRTATRKQQQVQADTLYLAGWVLLVTTLPPEQWSDQQVLCLYQARWHIELVFKRIKQLLGQHQLRCTTAATAQPTLTALLLGWALLEEESSAIRLAMREAMDCTQQAAEADQGEHEARQASWWQDGCHGPLSEWMVAEVSVDLFCQQLRGHYTAARYRACLPRLQRFLCLGHRKRPHLYSLICRWLGTPAAPLGQRGRVS
jgi:DDE family transposase